MKLVNKLSKQVVRSASSRKEEKTLLVKSVVVRPVFFASSLLLREWLEANHTKEKELWVGFYKKGSGKPTVTIDEVIDQCLCFGWIDGFGKSIDEESYTNRITPRNPKKSNWSQINIAKFQKLSQAGVITPAGQAAYERWIDSTK